MKDLERYVDEKEIDDAVFALWRTDFFRKSHREEGGYIRKVVAAYAKVPRLFCTLSDEKIERSHFLAWLGVTPRRDEYDNDAISDLYYFHEIVHQATMPYQAGQSFETFAKKMWDNERLASLESEVFVYFELPGFRELTFDFEIWADRYLEDDAMQTLFQKDNALFEKRFHDERERAMAEPKANDEAEALIAKYSDLNRQWAEVWRPYYDEVESCLARFTLEAERSRAEALSELVRFLEEKKGAGKTPYEAQAIAFTEHVRALYSS